MIVNANTAIEDLQLKWVNIKERKPEVYYTTFLKCIYENGNQVNAIGWLDDDDKWEIVWSDNHPMPEDIKYWLEEKGMWEKDNRLDLEEFLKEEIE